MPLTEPTEPKLSRRSTQDILDRLTQNGGVRNLPNTLWYNPGVDFCFYAPAQDACAKSRQRLRNLRLLDHEHQLLESSIQPKDVISKLLQIEAEQQDKASNRSSIGAASSKFVNCFCTFANSISNMVAVMLPHSPEYTVTFGMLFILFKAVVTKKDREESLLVYIENIGPRLPIMDFYQTVFPTDALKASVARTYMYIMKLLDEAIVYYRSWRLSKLLDAILKPNFKFDDYISQIDREIKTINEHKDAGHIAQSADMMDVVTDTGFVVAKLHESFGIKTNAIGISMEIINSKLDQLTLESGYLLHFEAVTHARSLQEALRASGRDAEDEFDAILSMEFHLSQKDHWENNGVLLDLFDWSQNERDQLLWIGGTSGNQHTWVTEFSADIVQALQPQLVTLLYVFCDHPDRERLTAMGLVRHLIVQLLNLHPELAYQRPEICNTWSVQKAATFRQLWHIFQQLAASISNLFIVIDRVEECLADEQGDLVNHLLPSLITLAHSLQDVSVLITSTTVAPMQIQGFPFYQIYIDTSNRKGDSKNV